MRDTIMTGDRLIDLKISILRLELTAALDKARNHERINTLLRQEKVKLKDDLENLYNQMGQQSKELREALQAKKLASQDHSDMTLKWVLD